MSRSFGDSAMSFVHFFVLLVMFCAGSVASTAVAQDRRPLSERPRDEFGLVPEDRTGRRGDDDLFLPDPRLDPDAMLPEPGEGGRRPEAIAPDEDETDPFRVEEPPPSRPIIPPVPPVPPGTPKPPAGVAPPAAPAPRPVPPLVGPDGRRDAGSPAPEADPAVPDALGRDIPEPSELEEDEMRPSPYDKDNALMDDEAEDMFGDDGLDDGAGE
jgi:hypothetical protein